MWPLLVLVLAGVTAVEQDEGVLWCTKVPQNSSWDSTCDVHTQSELSLKATNEDGRYRARLMVPQGFCRVERLMVTLYRYEFNQTQCSDHMNQRASSRIHSQQFFYCGDGEVVTSEDILSDNSKPRINLTYYFDLVYGGCYLIKFDITYNATFTQLREQTVWVENNHTEQEFDNRLNKTAYVTNVIGQSDPMTLLFQYRVSPEYVMELFKGDTAAVTLVKTLCSSEYKNDVSKIVCKMPANTGPGDYTIRYNAETGWCNGEPFQKYCFVTVTFTVMEAQDEHPPPSLIKDHSQDVLTIVAIGVSCLAVLALVLVVYYRFAKRKILCERDKEFLHKHFNYMNVKEAKADPCVDELKGIVLVYARDCEPFMDAMLQLRRLLEQRCAVKVYDIFDTDLLNGEISTSPQEWAVNMLKEPGVKFVVVKTPCGELLYDPAVSGDRNNGLHICEAALPSSVQYREPRFTDTLVHLLFRLVKDDAVLPGSYLKYFVVQICGFSGKKQLPQVNPYQRYELPAAAHLLVADLLNSGGGGRRDSDAQEQRLRLAVLRLADYIRDNPDYMLTRLLHVVS